MLLGAFALAPACSDNSDQVDDTVADGHNHGLDLADLNDVELSGADFLTQVGMAASVVASINDGEILQADLALDAVIDGDIAAYANDILIDHDDSNAALDSVLATYGIDFAPSSVADQIAAEASANLAVLRGSPPGDIDFNYLDIQVRQHAAALVVIDRLQDFIDDDVMGAFLADTEDMIEDHLDRGADLLDTFF
jgi:predicted outer membrane protein